MSISEQQTIYAEFLRQEGIEPAVADGEIHFVVDGGLYSIDADGSDRCFRIASPALYQPNDSPEEISKIHATCLAVTASCPVVKCYLWKDRVWTRVDHFVEKPEDFKSIFADCVDILRLGLMTFEFLMAESEGLHS